MWDKDREKELRQLVKDSGVKLLEENLVQGTWGNISVRLDEDHMLPEDRYQLSVVESGIRIAGGSDEALLHGVCTLRQWIRCSGALVPCIEIEDWPELAHRGFYQDVKKRPPLFWG